VSDYSRRDFSKPDLRPAHWPARNSATLCGGTEGHRLGHAWTVEGEGDAVGVRTGSIADGTAEPGQDQFTRLVRHATTRSSVLRNIRVVWRDARMLGVALKVSRARATGS